MSDAPFKDFDASWSESAKAAPTIKAFGRTLTLPKSPPFKLVLIIMRAREKDGDEAAFSERQVLDMFKLLLGAETANTLIDEGASIEQMEDVLEYAVELYDGGQDGDGAPPATGAQDAPSSPTGEPSKPTSSGSTDWLS